MSTQLTSKRSPAVVPRFLLGASLLVGLVVVVVGVAWASTTVIRFDSGSVWAMGTELSVSGVSQSGSSLVGTAQFSNSQGLSGVSGDLYVITVDLGTGNQKEYLSSATPSVASNTATWGFSLTVPSGEVFYGCRVSGQFANGAQTHAMVAKVAAHVEPF